MAGLLATHRHVAICCSIKLFLGWHMLSVIKYITLYDLSVRHVECRVEHVLT